MPPVLSEDERRQLERKRRRWALALAALVLLLAWLQSTRLDREVRSLPPTDRAALYARTLTTLEESCADAPSMVDYCREQAELIRAFPECDAHCRAVADRYAALATR